MSDTSDAAPQVEEQIPSDVESHETISLTESSGFSSSSEYVPATNTGAKRPLSEVSDTDGASEAGPAKKRIPPDPRKSWCKLYAKELNATILHVTQGEPVSDPLEDDLQIGASMWTPEERETLYQALARYGRQDTRRLSEHVTTKSSLEIDVFLRVLQRGSDEIITYHPRQCHRTIDTPAAVEVAPDLDRSLEQTADIVARVLDEDEEKDLFVRYGRLWLLDRAVVGLIASDGFDIKEFIASTDPISSDASAALDLFDFEEFFLLSELLFMNSSDPAQNYRTYNTDKTTGLPSIRLTAAVDLYRIVKTLTARFVFTAHHCALTRMRDGFTRRDGTTLEEPGVSVNDVSAALEILRQSNKHLRYDSAEYWRGMMRRHNVQPTAKKTPKGPLEPIKIDNAEWLLRQHISPNGPSRSKVGRAQSNHEKACFSDMQEDNQIEKLKRRNIDELARDYEAFTNDLGYFDASGSSDAESDKRLKMESEDEYAERKDNKEAERDDDRALKEDAIAAVEEAEYLWQLCRPDESGKVEEGGSEETDLPKRPSRLHPARRLDWSSHLDYMPEWERYQEPIALQIVEMTLTQAKRSLDAVESRGERKGVAVTNPAASGNDDAEEQEETATHSNQVTIKSEHVEDDIDTNMEDVDAHENADTESSVSDSSESSSVISTSSEE